MIRRGVKETKTFDIRRGQFHRKDSPERRALLRKTLGTPASWLLEAAEELLPRLEKSVGAKERVAAQVASEADLRFAQKRRGKRIAPTVDIADLLGDIAAANDLAGNLREQRGDLNAVRMLLRRGEMTWDELVEDKP